MERELLGAMLLKEGQIIPLVNSIVTGDDFYLTSHQTIFNAITNLYNRGIAPNIPSLVQELKETNRWDKWTAEIVLDLGEVAFSTAYAESWAKKIKEYSTRRNIPIAKQALTISTNFKFFAGSLRFRSNSRLWQNYFLPATSESTCRTR